MILPRVADLEHTKKAALGNGNIEHREEWASGLVVKPPDAGLNVDTFATLDGLRLRVDDPNAAVFRKD
jgi:hypothetical protein